jgi:hypothetical protein
MAHALTRDGLGLLDKVVHWRTFAVRRLVVQWFSGSVVQWFSGSVVQWFSGSVVQWFSGSVVQWFNDRGRRVGGFAKHL